MGNPIHRQADKKSEYVILLQLVFYEVLRLHHSMYLQYTIFIMEKNDTTTSNDLLNGMKRYLKIEHVHDDDELLKYLRKQAGLHQEEKY